MVVVLPNVAREGKPQYAKVVIQYSTCIVYAIIPLVKLRFSVEGDSESYAYREAWNN